MASQMMAHTVDNESDEDLQIDPIPENKAGSSNLQKSSTATSNNLMNRITGALLAKAFLPDPEDIKNSLKTLDLAIKFQIILFELSSSLFWCSLAEMFLFMFGFLLFCTDVTHMGAVFFHLLHVIRGVVGGLLVFKMPNTHDLLAEINIPKNQKVPI
jgi:hypothetical protein